jgi:hypothetical protein
MKMSSRYEEKREDEMREGESEKYLSLVTHTSSLSLL